MTLQEIYEKILIDIPKIEMRKFLSLFNEVQDILANEYDTANVHGKTTTIVATDDNQEWYDLPADCKGVTRINNENDLELKTYVCETGQIKFGFTGTFTIEYFGSPAKVTKLADTIEINSSFHQAIVKYMLSQLLPDRYEVLYREYNQLSNTANTRLKALKRKNMRIAAPAFR